ncbi:DUF6884 domain-containing protein [Nocardia nova]|uniref:DUF6884 domain-containing protein n=1 Tax=Nocardia nova TaxID=37330 RepID=UPI001FE7E90D|nr:DUF6884 domain-containing protein [Nocardia nova]
MDGEQFELDPDVVRTRLEGSVPEKIRDYWVEIDGTRWPVKQVISLATRVADRQRFQSESARRWLRNLGFTIGRDGASSTPRTIQAVDRKATVPGARRQPKADAVLVSCVKGKREHGAAAKDLYISDYFSKMRHYAEASGLPWFILSAEHGLLRPDDWLEPYERYLPDMSHEYRSDWGQRVAEQLETALGPLAGLTFEVHAGSAYVQAIEPYLRAAGAQVVDELHGLSIGRRLAWYTQRTPGDVDDASEVVGRLGDTSRAMSLDDVMASGGVGLRTPGMYSWWVDDAGAADLTTGLGHAIAPGLIYAGLAGATRKGGASSSNTLWGRIATMHLGRKHEFSTLRRSLGSILAHANGQSMIDEAQLTLWMHAHLRVVLIPVANADRLDDLETEILAELDPPLNIAKVARTPLRQRLSALRKQYAVSPTTTSNEGPM